jgi:hypothetical protein
VQQLQANTNYIISYNTFSFNDTVALAAPVLKQTYPSKTANGVMFFEGYEFNMFRDCASGNATDSVYFGIPIPPQTHPSIRAKTRVSLLICHTCVMIASVNFGCEDSDYDGVPAGAIALADRTPQGGNCTNYLKVVHTRPAHVVVVVGMVLILSNAGYNCHQVRRQWFDCCRLRRCQV